ncbi:hypothetical protein LTR17_003905 [Elasticomyces elasticus]|nr:hypothetical protein LTR17_003905 [Elasticomyces elasticus]
MAKLKADQAFTQGTMPTPKKAQRRLKVLSTHEPSSSQQTIYNTNATSSPLLKLPPEIRNRIWGFLFGGKTVHVQGDYYPQGRRRRLVRRRLVHMVCQVPNSDKEISEQITRHNELDGSTQCFQSYWDRHRHCYAGGATKKATLPMAVLRTCRQIHQEAALLPFQLNEFSFSQLENLAPFLQSLFQAQARAIESLILQIYRPYHTITLKNLIKSKLRGLKELTCFVEICRGKNTLEGSFSDWTSCLELFLASTAISATVLPYVSGNGDARTGAPSRATLHGFATKVGKRMVVPVLER